MAARLVITRQGAQYGEVELGEVAIIGREPGVEAVLVGEGVSRHHARISRSEDGYLIEDLWSRNGTFVGRRRVRRTLLRDGDVIDVCDYSLTFQLGPESEAKRRPMPTMVLDEAPAAPMSASAVPVTADGSVAAPPAEKAEIDLLRARLRAIYEVTDAVGVTLTLNEFLDRALEKLLEIFPQADVAILFLRDPAGGAMPPRASRLRPGLDPNQVTVSTTVLQETAKKRQALRSSVAAEDPRFRATMTIRRHSIASLMCVPLLYREEVTGLLYVDSRRAGVAFQEDDLALLSWLGKEISLALERARMQRELLQRQRVERDLHLAAEVQRSFLPQAAPEVPGYGFAFHHASATGVGGDFYDFLPLAGGRLALAIGEVAGKGVSAAVLMARVTSDIRYLSLQHPAPAALLNRINALLLESAPRGSFATMLYGVLDPPTRRLTIASAAHLAPIRVRPALGVAEEVELPRQFPLGALDDTQYEEVTLQLDEGDLLVLYTDGVVDASDADGEWYGENRLQRIIASAPREPKAMLDALVGDIGSFAGAAGQNDDLTVVILHAGVPLRSTE
jgi:serine phosphatase RsbU (regulator of sigma subunit)